MRERERERGVLQIRCIHVIKCEHLSMRDEAAWTSRNESRAISFNLVKKKKRKMIKKRF